MAPLKLGKLPDRETTKITFNASAELRALLADYAAAYEKEYGRREALTDLIPHILTAFIKGDRGFKKGRGGGENLRSGLGSEADGFPEAK
ncbi:DUF2274 domain-containing protein [uncultured Sneathiella sp.]|jgi:hypothetical protein|uniref:DUF2274 domain-containing protein n=1 Tax=uncultured Sneathiella sp. TaxID=879315 RepID=UPI0030D76CDD|tara:strand:+ start:428 stop:697 length:270 start_codon:yes stop_codon:yes gene_type:complete